MDPVKQRELLSASDARARLPELFEHVTVNPGATVYIAGPHNAGAAVLVDSAHYEVLLLKAELSDSLGLPERRSARSE